MSGITDVTSPQIIVSIDHADTRPTRVRFDLSAKIFVYNPSTGEETMQTEMETNFADRFMEVRGLNKYYSRDPAGPSVNGHIDQFLEDKESFFRRCVSIWINSLEDSDEELDPIDHQ